MPKPKAESKEKGLDFGAAYKELENIIEWFEQEDVDLEEGLKKFERGLQLAKGCKERLKEVENRVTEIKAKFGALEDDAAEQEPLL
ncbi:MAG TPA: exodeoxyribonuclease VII small subunit [Candidatus Eisenbacteria bacterium]|jgi:exodeoxyribonuclease VII small subunit|nr:exodeoxyribonuclease VII small subunit [Candidatus Eisenbacteria bacterium]